MVIPMQEQNIKICKGPGCKAWSSEQITLELLDVNEVRVCRVPCMKVCGGGASIRVNGKRKILKLKQVEDLLSVLGVGGAAAFA
jgi:hypothetical protein